MHAYADWLPYSMALQSTSIVPNANVWTSRIILERESWTSHTQISKFGVPRRATSMTVQRKLQDY